MTLRDGDSAGGRTLMTAVTLPAAEEKLLLGIVEAGAPLRMGQTLAYAKAKDGTFPVEVLRIGGRLFVRTADLKGLDADRLKRADQVALRAEVDRI
jgi:hypothetical protein